jgi:hypothetical protein
LSSTSTFSRVPFTDGSALTFVSSESSGSQTLCGSDVSSWVVVDKAGFLLASSFGKRAIGQVHLPARELFSSEVGPTQQQQQQQQRLACTTDTFSSLAAWTLSNTANGGTETSTETTFEVVAGEPGPSWQFQVGEVSFDVKDEGGIVLSQNISVNPGDTFALDVAVDYRGGNADGGTFSLVVNGTTVASFASGSDTSPSQPLRAHLNGTYTGPAGVFPVQIVIVRHYIHAFDTPYQYITNFVHCASGLGGTE